MLKGNRRFRVLIDMNLEAYKKSDTKLKKTSIVLDILEAIRLSSPNGGFIKFRKGRWYEVGDHLAREKIGQS